nr:MAG TPA: Tc3 transposase [Caudoviricetes sp.]
MEGRTGAAARPQGRRDVPRYQLPEFEQDRRPEQPKRKDAYTEHDLCVIRNSIEDGESVSMIAWRLGRSLPAVTYKIRKMRRAGEL